MRMQGLCLALAAVAARGAWAQAYPLADAAETNALAEIRAQQTAGLIAVQPWIQLAGEGRVGVGWTTTQAADGVAEWRQPDGEGATSEWRTAWFSEDGLKQACGTSQRAVITGFAPDKPLHIRVKSRPLTSFRPYKVVFGEPEYSRERVLPALSRRDGSVSFAVFNDIHNREQFYPLLMAKAGRPVDFAVFNGDVLQDPQSERELADHLLSPMAWFASKGWPCFFLRGNHETRGAFARQMKAFLVLPEGRYYTAMTFGSARVVFLDSGEDKPDSSVEYSGLVDFDPYIEDELVWLKREMAGEAFKKAAWRVVVMHIPPDWRVEEAELWHGQRRVNDRFRALFDEGGVTVVISGHQHKQALVEPCPDQSRGFRWPVFIGGAHPLAKATVIRVDADASSLRVQCVRSDGSVAAEQAWKK